VDANLTTGSASTAAAARRAPVGTRADSVAARLDRIPPFGLHRRMGVAVGSALSVPLVERFERKHLIVASALGIGAFGLVFGFADAQWLILVAGFATTSVSNVFSNSFHIYQAEIFPTRIRGTAVGAAYSLSRLSGAILPFISVTVLDNLGANAVFIGCATIMVVLCLDIGILGPRSTGMNLEDASDEAANEPEEPRFRVSDPRRYAV
jgi:MFS family permease